MEKQIHYSTVEEQIEKLRSQHLHIENVQCAREVLYQIGYSKLIKSYRQPYIIRNEGDMVEYRSGVTFQQIHSLYLLDKNIRNSVMAAMLDLEEHIKASAADVIAQAFGTDQSEYLKFSNYRDRSHKKKQFQLSGLLDKMREKSMGSNAQVRHYRKKYGTVPPWILFDSIYFSDMVNFIDKFKPEQKEALTRRIYDLDLPLENVKKLMMDTFFMCNEYRNNAAHGDRVFDLKTRSIVRYEEIFQEEVEPQTGIGQLVSILRLMKYQQPCRILEEALEKEVTRHCRSFPTDVTYLGQVLNVDIDLGEGA